jgi:hypothetical protein
MRQKKSNHGPSEPVRLRHRGPTTQDDILLELQDKKAILAAAERLAKLRGWSYDVASHSLQWSSDASSIFAFSPYELQNPSLSHFFERIHAEDRPALESLVDEVLKDKRRTFTFKYRFLAAPGRHKSLLATERPWSEPTGKSSGSWVASWT